MFWTSEIILLKSSINTWNWTAKFTPSSGGKKPTNKPSNSNRQHPIKYTVNHIKNITGDMPWVRRNLPESLFLFLMATIKITLDLLMKRLLLVHKILPSFYHYSLTHTQSPKHKHAKEIPKHKNQPKKKKTPKTLKT